MSHRDQRNFCDSVKRQHPKHFINATVLDVGSLDVNGSTRVLFQGGTYLGIDYVAGKGVDRVCSIHDVTGTFSVITSTEALEHDPQWQQTLAAMHARLRPGGLLMLTCAGPGRAEHGTKRCPMPGMQNQDTYYGNLTPMDLLSNLPMQDYAHYAAFYQSNNFDTYLWGIRR